MKKTKKRKIKKKPIIIILILIILIGLATYFVFFNKEDKKEVTKIKNVDTIEGYDYYLSENATKYYKKLFNQLKDLLASEDVDEEEYASLVAKMFAADFFNLDNKISKTDVGGLQFVYKDFRDDFIKLAASSMYKTVESNVYGDRKQELPVVTSVVTEKKDSSAFKYGDNTDDKALVFEFTITYENDLGYQETGTITLIHNDKKLEVAALE